MASLELILLFLLHFEACISRDTTNLYFRHGENAVLPCSEVDSRDAKCFTITWLYSRDCTQTTTEIEEGVVRSQSRADRLSLGADCALVIDNVTAEDAGWYTCRQSSGDMGTDLIILTISASPPDADGRVTLNCSLSRYARRDPCRLDRIRWLDEAEAELQGGDDGYELVGQKSCASALIVKPQRGTKRRYRCRVTDERGEAKIDADHTFVSPDSALDPTPIYIVAAVGGVVTLVVISVLIRCRNRVKVTESPQKTARSSGDPDDGLTYVTLSHTERNSGIPKKQTEVEELEVTYSTVRTSL